MRYAPNQFERGARLSCIAALRVRAGRSLRVAVCDDPRMGDVAVSSAEKAALVREEMGGTAEGQLDAEPLLAVLGRKRLALCLVDAEDYELVFAHSLFDEAVLEAETVLELEESRRMPCTVGRVVGRGNAVVGVESAVRKLGVSELCDVSALAKALSYALEAHGLPTFSAWLLPT